MATKSVGTLAAKLLLDTKGWTAGFAGAQKTAKGFATNVGASISSAVKSYGAMATAAVAGALSVQSLGKSFTDVDRQAKLADRLGIAVGEVQKLSLAADLAGTDVELLAKSMLKMGKNIGSGGMPLDKRLFQVADALAEIKDPAARGARAEAIFGKGGAELINVLIQGGNGIRNSASAIDRYGLAISRVDAAKIEAANDAWTEMKTVLGGLRNQIAVEMAPTITTFLQDWLRGLELIHNRQEAINSSMQKSAGQGNYWHDYVSALFAVGMDPKTGSGIGFSQVLEGLREQRIDAAKNSSFTGRGGLGGSLGGGGSVATAGAVERGSVEAARVIAAIRGGEDDVDREMLKELQKIARNSDPSRAGAAFGLARL